MALVICLWTSVSPSVKWGQRYLLYRVVARTEYKHVPSAPLSASYAARSSVGIHSLSEMVPAPGFDQHILSSSSWARYSAHGECSYLPVHICASIPSGTPLGWALSEVLALAEEGAGERIPTCPGTFFLMCFLSEAGCFERAAQLPEWKSCVHPNWFSGELDFCLCNCC